MGEERVRLRNCPFCGHPAWAEWDAGEQAWHLMTTHDHGCVLWPFEEYLNEFDGETWADAAEGWERRAS